MSPRKEQIMFNLNHGLLIYLFGELHLATEQWQITLTKIAFIIVSLVAAYFLGSINSAIIVSKVLYRDDIRNHGSGNAGLTNVLRTYGAKAALLTLFGDIMKTVIAVCIPGILLGFYYSHGVSTGEGYCYLAGLFAVIGHVFPIYYKFKGGKGVLTTATMALVLSPVPFLLLLLVFVLIVAATKYVSLGSVTAVGLYPVLMHAYFAFALNGRMHGFTAASLILIAILIIWCHRGNLSRISNRTERKLSFKKKNDNAKEN